MPPDRLAKNESDARMTEPMARPKYALVSRFDDATENTVRTSRNVHNHSSSHDCVAEGQTGKEHHELSFKKAPVPKRTASVTRQVCASS